MALFVTLCHFLGAVSAVHAVMNARTSQGSIAWSVSLVSFPYVAVPAYWVLGRSQFHGYILARRASEDNSLRLALPLIDAVTPYVFPEDAKSSPTRAAEALAKMPALRGNAVDLLVDGQDTFASILDGIHAATNYVLFQFYIVHDDKIGREFQEALISKARGGVSVYFLYDEIGSHTLPESYKQEMRDAGVQVLSFHTRKGRSNRFQINFRNHRKVVVVDGAVAWIGGHNVGDEYLGKDPDFGHWRDTHIRIVGPAALAAQLSFVEDWYWAAEEVPALSWVPVPSPIGDQSVLVMPTGPADELETAALMFIHAINTATERVWIASPYFVPDEAIVSAIQLAGLRGVDVRILIPEKADHLGVWLAAFSYFDEATKTGAAFYKYMDGFLHHKAFLIDHQAAGIGTANFDNRSFRLNFEITAIMSDPGFVEDVADMFEADFAKSRKVKNDEYSSKPFWFRLGVKIARLTAPVQ